MKHTKNIRTLVHDIYDLMETKEVADGADADRICSEFGRACGQLLREQIQPEEARLGLRLSAVGKPFRQIYNSYHGVSGEPIDGKTYIKFLYGHITEELVLALTELAGHDVTERQKVCTVEGVKGHQDCRIDGKLIDVKSASAFGFKKFKNNTLHKDDAFGYIGQLKAYAHEEGDTEYGWLAMDKQNGSLALLMYDEEDKGAPYAEAVNWDVAERVRTLKKTVGSSSVPSVCYDPVPDGKSGNEKLQTGCVYCPFKFTCWPDVEVYWYSQGPKYLTKVVREPRVHSGNAPLPEGF
jgi:hypothetical protein